MQVHSMYIFCICGDAKYEPSTKQRGPGTWFNLIQVGCPTPPPSLRAPSLMPLSPVPLFHSFFFTVSRQLTTVKSILSVSWGAFRQMMNMAASCAASCICGNCLISLQTASTVIPWWIWEDISRKIAKFSNCIHSFLLL